MLSHLQIGLTLHTHTPHQTKYNTTILLEKKISFLLDSGASISVLNNPTYVTIAKLLNIKQQYP